MTKYIVPFTEIRVLSYEVEASSKHEAAMKVGAARERGEDCNDNQLISTRMRPIVIAPAPELSNEGVDRLLKAVRDTDEPEQRYDPLADEHDIGEPQLTPPRHTK